MCHIDESGCGKSMTSLAPMGLLPRGAGPAGNSKLFGETLVGADQDKLCALRGGCIGMVFQQQMTALKADAWRPAIGVSRPPSYA